MIVSAVGAVPAAARTGVHRHARAGQAHRHKPVREQAPTVLSVSTESTPGAHRATPEAPAVERPQVPATCASTDLMPASSDLGAIDAATLCLIDRIRIGHGLVPLADDPRLDRAALAHSQAMVDLGYFDHIGPDGLSVDQRMRATGFVPQGPGEVVAENIAAATLSVATPAATVSSWMSSPDHRANILDPEFRTTGLAAVLGVPAMLGSEPGATYTEDFA